MESIQNSMIKSSRVMYVILKIARIGTYVGIGLMLASVLWIMVVPEEMHALQLGAVRILAPYGQTDMTYAQLMLYFVGMAVALGFTAALLQVAGNIFKDIQVTAKPFTDKNVKRVKTLAVLVLWLGIAPTVAQLCLMGITIMGKTYFGFGPQQMFSNTMDAGVCLIAVLFWCLAKVFAYGAQLQQLADETL